VGRTTVIKEDNARQSATSNIVPCLSETERLLSAQVDDLKHIHSLSLRLAEADTLAEVLIDVLRTAAQLVNASLGSVQLLAPDGKLGMIGQIGFGDSILDQFAVVGLEDCSTCAVALNRRCRVIVRDLRADPTFTEIAAALRDYGAVAAVSTPILDKAGNVLAMFSLYWPDEHEPDERELGALDLCAELAGRHVERSVAAKMLRDHNQRQALLMRELAHRGKNLLSIIQSIAAQSLRGERTLDEAREVFIGRLGALANTYNTLTDEAPESVQLYNIISADLKIYSERASIQGPAIAIPARNTQTLALAIHELTTNAAKYGALSMPSGRIEVAWQIVKTDGAEERFTLEWLEKGGAPAEPPARRGFGSALLTSFVGNELKCVPKMEYCRSGFQYRLECALNSLVDSATEVV
jgi:two-component sensor histidine kinase